jgi:hydroxymethylbilane synthase
MSPAPPHPIRLASRGSALALAQAGPVADRLGAELVVIETAADDDFVGALRAALRAGEVDAAVHSVKHMPLAVADGLAVAAIPRRGDARDALCARDGLTLDDLPQGARVGTSSPRRRAQLLARRPDLRIVDVHGGVRERIDKLGPELDAVVLAAEGIDRLGHLDAVTEFLGIDAWPTSAAQGALAIEVRAGDEKKVSKLDHRPSRLAVEAERGILTRIGADRPAPIGTHALLDDGLLFLTARVYAPDGSTQLTSSHALYPEDSLHPAADLAERVSQELLEAGAARLIPLAVGGAA